MRPEQRDLRRVTLGAAFILVFLICIMDSPRVHPQSGPLPLGVPPQSAAEKSGKAWQATKGPKGKTDVEEAWKEKAWKEKAGKEKAAKAGKEKMGKEKAEKAKSSSVKKEKSGKSRKATKSDDEDGGKAKSSRCPPGQIYDKRSKGCL